MKRPYDLTSMTALTCFEAAARHVSFKADAQELNVTPAAVAIRSSCWRPSWAWRCSSGCIAAWA